MTDSPQNAAPQARVPADANERHRMRECVREYVAEQRLVPPLSMEELQNHAAVVSRQVGENGDLTDFVTVLVGNAVWRETMAAVPYERRVLLLPQCLRRKDTCPAELDEIGLLCEECGGCAIGEIQAEAESLGYVVLVAEGTTVVTRLLESGKVDAVVGVSCLTALEKSFPHMAADAIPGMAIPLLADGCTETSVDCEWVREIVRLKSDRPWIGRQDIEVLRTTIRNWFETDPLDAVLGKETGETDAVCRSWLARSGKRWRPLLAACVYKTLSGDDSDSPEAIREIAVAVECFHKASLVHDDIEDDDAVRYGEQTLHREYGIPIALNAGDLLLGEGYRLISACGAPPEQVVRMLAVAAQGHCNLCRGQGDELAWCREPTPLTCRRVIEIFRHKTAPAFEVALSLGAIRAGAPETVCAVLRAYSEALGIAYQIRDDLEDSCEEGSDGNEYASRPTLLMALAYEQADDAERERLENTWRTPSDRHSTARGSDIQTKARQLLEYYKNEAVRSLAPLQNAHLKGLLRRMVGKILGTTGGNGE